MFNCVSLPVCADLYMNGKSEDNTCCNVRTAVVRLQNSRFPLKIGFARHEILAM